MCVRSIFAMLLFSIVSNVVLAQSAGTPGGKTVLVKPQSEFAKIDTRATLDIAKRLNSSSTATRARAIQEVKSSPGKFAPPALYALSNALFQQGQKDDALFWFYLGQLRARSDANKSTDESAREAVAVLNSQYGPTINHYAFRNVKVNYKKNLQDIKALAGRMVDWDRKHPREYDPRWISLHGMGAFLSQHVAFEPKERWEKINEQTRVNYLKELDESSQLFRDMDANRDGAVTKEETEAYMRREKGPNDAEIARQIDRIKQSRQKSDTKDSPTLREPHEFSPE
jgi:hypothetical protein